MDFKKVGCYLKQSIKNMRLFDPGHVGVNAVQPHVTKLRALRHIFYVARFFYELIEFPNPQKVLVFFSIILALTPTLTLALALSLYYYYHYYYIFLNSFCRPIVDEGSGSVGGVHQWSYVKPQGKSVCVMIRLEASCQFYVKVSCFPIGTIPPGMWAVGTIVDHKNITLIVFCLRDNVFKKMLSFYFIIKLFYFTSL